MDTKYRIHFGYIIAILVAIIILFATVKWGEIPDLVRYITFALTLTSLVLAVLAIIYAFLSNSSISGTVSSLQGLSEQVSHTTLDLTKATDALKQEVAQIPIELRSVRGGIEETQKILKEYSQKKEFPGDSTPLEATLNERVEPFLGMMSNIGLLMLFACALAFEKKLAFDQRKFASSVERFDSEYAFGFLVATSSIGLLDIRVSEERTINVTSFNEHLLKGIDRQILDRIETEKGETKESLSKRRKAISDYFENL